MSDNKAKRAAQKVLNEYHISRPTLDNIIFILDSNGFEIIDYGTNDNKIYSDVIINQLALSSLKINKGAWTYINGDLKIIFVYEDLSQDEKAYVLAHELGHIVCGHFSDENANSASEEKEANEFAHYFLNPHTVIRAKSTIFGHKNFLILFLIVIVVISAVTVSGVLLSKEHKYHEHFYITDSGEKYHRKNCVAIEGKQKHRLTEEEYDSGRYEACRLCLPDE